MAVQPVPTLTEIPPFPQTADRASGTYNSKALAFGNHMADTFNDEIEALADNVHHNATEAATAATTLSGAADTATAAAIAASADRVLAQTAASAAASKAGESSADRVLAQAAATAASNSASQAAASAASASAIVLGVSTGHPKIRPTLLLDFANSRSVDPRITFTRASTATRTNEKRLIETVAANVPRIDFDPVTGECRGLLVEGSRTNVLLNSLIDGTPLTTQSVTVTAVAHTLTFYGTGQVVFSGAHSATLTGTGAFPNSTVLTFAPTAGTLTLTVTGDVKYAQLELGSFPTSYIPTTSAASTRAADAASMSGANFSEWFKPLEGTFVFTGSFAAIDMAAVQEHYLLSASNGGATNYVALRGFSGTGVYAGSIYVDARCVTASVEQADTSEVVVAVNSTFKEAVAFRANDFASSTNASTPSTDTSVTLPVVNTLYIGSAPNAVSKNCHIKRIAYYPKRLTNAELQALTA